jgi:hypothetical protein
MLGVVVLGQTALVEQVAMLELVAVVVLVQQVEVVALEMLAAEVSLVAEGHGRWESRVAAPKDATGSVIKHLDAFGKLGCGLELGNLELQVTCCNLHIWHLTDTFQIRHLSLTNQCVSS